MLMLACEQTGEDNSTRFDREGWTSEMKLLFIYGRRGTCPSLNYGTLHIYSTQ